MRNLMSATAIAALMITAPAEACTDWKAVAAFDALILEGDKIAVKEERSPEAAPLIEAGCRQAQKLLDYAINGKDQSLIDQRAKLLANCQPYLSTGITPLPIHAAASINNIAERNGIRCNNVSPQTHMENSGRRRAPGLALRRIRAGRGGGVG